MAAVRLDPRYARHSCRHSYATRMHRMTGHDLEVSQEQLGHASIKTTTIYAKATKEDKAWAAEALPKAYRGGERKAHPEPRGPNDDHPVLRCLWGLR